jgi:hypothetical protein
VYTVGEAARILKLGQHRVRQLLREGALEGFRDETTDRWFAYQHAVHALKEERDAKARISTPPEQRDLRQGRRAPRRGQGPRAGTGAPTADFSVVDPYRMMHTDGSTEKPIQPVVHA